jgi:hypothetical protein
MHAGRKKARWRAGFFEQHPNLGAAEGLHYWPVAVTLQFTIKVTVLFAGKVVIVSPAAKKLVAPLSTVVLSGILVGQDAPPVVAEQVTEVHCKPTD